MSRLFKRKALSFQPSVSRKVVSSFGLDKPRKNADESQPFASKNTMSLKSFKIKTNGDLSRTWLILRLSSIDSFVNHSEKVTSTYHAYHLCLLLARGEAVKVTKWLDFRHVCIDESKSSYR